jgi:pilus assembly protein CpaB
VQRQSIIFLGVAILLGLIAVFLANQYLSRGDAVAERATALTKVAVAAVPIEFGAEVTPEKVRFVGFPSESVPAGSFQSAAALLPAGGRRVALRPMVPGEPILRDKLSGEGGRASMSANLREGMRAVAIPTSAVAGVAGFVLPNDVVDVLITRTLQSGEQSEQITDVLLRNVRVIAIDQLANEAASEPKVGATATLEVTPIDAQKLTLGQKAGALSLALRKPGSQEADARVATVSIRDLRDGAYAGAYRIPPAVSAGPRPAPVERRKVVARPTLPAAKPATNNVGVVRGTTESSYEVGPYGGV